VRRASTAVFGVSPCRERSYGRRPSLRNALVPTYITLMSTDITPLQIGGTPLQVGTGPMSTDVTPLPTDRGLVSTGSPCGELTSPVRQLTSPCRQLAAPHGRLSATVCHLTSLRRQLTGPCGNRSSRCLRAAVRQLEVSLGAGAPPAGDQAPANGVHSLFHFTRRLVCRGFQEPRPRSRPSTC